MLLPRTRPIAETLIAIERAIALLSRCHPLNSETEQPRLVAEWCSGKKTAPRWVYGEPRSGGHLRRALHEARDRAAVARAAASDCVEAFWLDVLCERAAELDLEVTLSEAVGGPSFCALAARRFPDPSGAEGDPVATLVQAWLDRPISSSDEPRVSSDDDRHPESLVSMLRSEIARRNVAIRVEVRRRLASVAATGAGVVFVRAGAPLSLREAARIALHEIEGHALPRLRAETLLGALGLAGGRGGNDDEEGRALWLEQQSGLRGAERQRELALRHLAAKAVRRGADYVETVCELLAHTGVEPALAVATRAHRGGGLGREIVYLPAFLRVERGHADDPRILDVLATTRLSVRDARRALAAGVFSPSEAPRPRARDRTAFPSGAHPRRSRPRHIARRAQA